MFQSWDIELMLRKLILQAYISHAGKYCNVIVAQRVLFYTVMFSFKVKNLTIYCLTSLPFPGKKSDPSGERVTWL